MLKYRLAKENDVDLYFKWTNDQKVRNNSYNQELVLYGNHVKWFKNKLNSTNIFFLLFYLDGLPHFIGQVRLEKEGDKSIIGISIDQGFRGQGWAAKMLIKACEFYFSKFKNDTIIAFVKEENISSYRSFLKAGFKLEDKVVIQNSKSYKLIKNAENREL
jgi:UDP-2,4-diacetamido-2,4,6-trideoxy-beta-L-altropyranose hydrolase